MSKIFDVLHPPVTHEPARKSAKDVATGQPEPGSTNLAESVLLRALRDQPAASLSELARRTEMTQDATDYAFRKLEGRSLVRRATGLAGASYYEAVKPRTL